jgi:hypothetical protein
MQKSLQVAITLIQMELSCFITSKLRLAMYTSYKAQRI